MSTLAVFDAEQASSWCGHDELDPHAINCAQGIHPQCRILAHYTRDTVQQFLDGPSDVDSHPPSDPSVVSPLVSTSGGSASVPSRSTSSHSSPAFGPLAAPSALFASLPSSAAYSRWPASVQNDLSDFFVDFIGEPASESVASGNHLRRSASFSKLPFVELTLPPTKIAEPTVNAVDLAPQTPPPAAIGMPTSTYDGCE